MRYVLIILAPMLLIGALNASPAFQTTRTVNAAEGTLDGSNGRYARITDAIAGLGTDDTVLIEGSDDQGNPFGYSETPIQAGLPGETFPINVPSGIVIRKTGSDPVYIWTENSNLRLFEITGGTFNDPTTLRELNLIAGESAVRVRSIGDVDVVVFLRALRISRSRIMVSTIS